MSAAALEDKTAFARASGVGSKLATRVATELSGKAPPTGRGFQATFTPPVTASAGESERNEGLSDMRLRNDAVSALENLGIGQSEALRAIATAFNTFTDNPSLDDLIKTALKELGS